MFHNENKENYDETNMNKRKVINCDKNKNDNISFAFNKLLNYKQKKFKDISLSFPHYSNLSTKKLKFANKDDIKLKELNLLYKSEIKKIFKIQKEKLIYEIEYFYNNPSFNYDFVHQKDNNSNFQYINENFIDILLLSYGNNLILNKNIKPIQFIQKEVTFQKRNILLSWLTEINMKYIKNQNILFLGVKYLDKILYLQNISINDFQLIGILCLNLASKLENYLKVIRIDEILSLITDGEIKDNKIYSKLIKKIKSTEMKICQILNFDLHQSTSVLMVNRLIQIMDIGDKKIENIFKSISYFFLELSLYDEEFYVFNEFDKALSSIVLAKLILERKNIKLGFHEYLRHCSLIKKEEIKKYFALCQKCIKTLKNKKYGTTLLCKYQTNYFYYVVNTYLIDFINQYYI